MAEPLRARPAPLDDEELWGTLDYEFDWGSRSAVVVVLLVGVLLGFVVGVLAGALLV